MDEAMHLIFGKQIGPNKCSPSMRNYTQIWCSNIRTFKT